MAIYFSQTGGFLRNNPPRRKIGCKISIVANYGIKQIG
jgi:hypothetical protein